MTDEDLVEVSSEEENFDIAIIGMVGRFPGAENIEVFWQNLARGVESIASFSDDELRALGVSDEVLRAPDFVKAGAILKNVDLFDAGFFNLNPREAAMMDPQHRIFLESAVEALEAAGYDPERYQGLIGVYAGTSLSTYLLFNLLANPALVGERDSFQAMIGNDKDFLCTRVSYHLDLKGPGIDVQTGCSTSLVAVHLACQALLSYQCDMALAGGISVSVPQKTGYYYQEGGIASPDGHCRVFDAEATGTIFGSGVGIVVLKRLGDALADRDTIHAVIKGSAVNNDGASKLGYTAPGSKGQAEVIVRAQAMAGVAIEHIGYIEAHGTGTALGDPIEVAALTRAFRTATTATQFCALGSVKANIGHLDAAAGVAGLIKSVLALKHRQIPPSLNFVQPNPNIDFSTSPFYVNTALTPWPASVGSRYAGVSSFGIGGTNAHLILGEAPEPRASPSPRTWQLLVLSARTSTALQLAQTRLAAYLLQHPTSNLGDVAYTLQVGRRTLEHRCALVGAHLADVVAQLQQADRLLTSFEDSTSRPVVFLFPGGGTQYINMGLELYQEEPVFREQVDLCARLLKRHLGFDVRTFLYPRQDASVPSTPQLTRTSLVLPALFTVEYALAQVWMQRGVHPQAMLGHSLGEYVAACLAGVFSLDDALALVSLRGRLLERLPAGSMLSVALTEEEVRPYLQGALSLAAINGPTQCVVAGPDAEIEALMEVFARREVEFRRIYIDVAAHSQMVTPVLAEFGEFVARLQLHLPTIPYISGVTGDWATEEVTDPRYWVRHLRQTVRFADGLRVLLQDETSVLLEVGPGQTLSTLARLQAGVKRARTILTSIRHPHEQQSDLAFFLTTLGKLWLAGVPIAWEATEGDEERRRRVPLPTYPFERSRYWIEPGTRQDAAQSQRGAGKIADVTRWLYLPSWKRTLSPAHALSTSGAEDVAPAGTWLIFADAWSGLGDGALLEHMVRPGRRLVVVRPGSSFARLTPDRYTLNPCAREEYARLLADIVCSGQPLLGIVHLWSLTEHATTPDPGLFQTLQENGYYSLLWLMQALAQSGQDLALQLEIISNYLYDLSGSEVFMPEKALLTAIGQVIPQEFPGVRCRCIDVALTTPGMTLLARQLAAEIESSPTDAVIAYRGRQRLVQDFLALDLERARKSALRERGVYLLIGGLGNIGLLLAEHLAVTRHARLVLTGRSALPAREHQETWLITHPEDDPISQRIQQVQRLEALGAEVLTLHLDLTSANDLHATIAQTQQRFGVLNGVIHLAGQTGEKALQFMTDVEQAFSEQQFAAKVYGLYTLATAVQDLDLDFCLLFSSNASILGGLGSLTYTAASLFMDAFAAICNRKGRTHWISVNWDGWLRRAATQLQAGYRTSLDQFAMLPEESVSAFEAVLSVPEASQVVVSTGDLQARLNVWIRHASGPDALTTGTQTFIPHARPEMATTYAPPTSELEQMVATAWQELLGIEQIGIYDNFFELGGNSLIGLKIISRLKQELQREIPAVTLFEGPTINTFAQILDQGRPAASYEKSRNRGAKRRERLLKKQEGGE